MKRRSSRRSGQGAATGCNGGAACEEYLTVKEAAKLLRVSEATVRNKMSSGTLRVGQQFYRRRGLGPRFKRSALEAWIEGRDVVEGRLTEKKIDPLGGIPMVRRRLTRTPRQA